jgi:hypothetical protein
VSHADAASYQPTNITFGIMPALEQPPRGKQERKTALSGRALADLNGWIAQELGTVTNDELRVRVSEWASYQYRQGCPYLSLNDSVTSTRNS